MTYKKDLQLAFSGKEIASQRIEIIESTVFENETAEQFSRGRREKYQKLLEQSDKKISEIKSRIAEDISAKKFQLENFQNERTQVNTRYKLGELSYEEHEKIENGIRKKFEKVRNEASALQQLYETSTSSEIGGQIPLDIDKDVDDYGNIIKKSGMQIPSIPTDFRVPSGISDGVSDIVSKVKQHDGISIQGINLSRGNLISLVGAIGVIIVILFLASAFTSSAEDLSYYLEVHADGTYDFNMVMTVRGLSQDEINQGKRDIRLLSSLLGDDIIVDGDFKGNDLTMTIKSSKPFAIQKSSQVSFYSFDGIIGFGMDSSQSPIGQIPFFPGTNSGMLTLKMPGKILESNADKVKGDTAV